MRPPKHMMDKIKPLHKDTDLGYFAGLVIKGLLSNPKIGTDEKEASFEPFVKYCIELSKEMIKQLDQEST